MENASKALIIAGAILLSILIIALGIYVFNMAKGATNTNSLDELEVSQFNSEFKNYEGKKLGSGVIDLIDKVVTNAGTYSDSDERLPDFIYIETRASGGANVDKVKNHESIDANAKDAVEYAGLNTTAAGSSSSFMVVSNSADPHIKGLGSIRNIIAEKHYYQVKFVNNDASGLIEYIIVQY